MKLTPQISLSFDGQCRAAFAYYEQHLGATVSFMMTWKESPMAADVPPEWADRIMHATLKVGDVAIAGGDVPPGLYVRLQGFSVMLQMDDPAAADRIFHALAEGGTVLQPLQETFWAARFGSVFDRFGVPWTINCEAAGAKVS